MYKYFILLFFFPFPAWASPDAIPFKNGVPQHVLANREENGEWAKERHKDAYLYSIVINSVNGDSTFQDITYHYFSPGKNVHFTSMTDARYGWAGSQDFPWPTGQRLPIPLPEKINVDFNDVWEMGQKEGIRRVNTALLESSDYKAVPRIAWAMPGDMPEGRERGLYVDAISGERIRRNDLYDPPTSDAQIIAAVNRMRGAYGGGGGWFGGGTSAGGADCAGGTRVWVPGNGCLDLYNRNWSQ